MSYKSREELEQKLADLRQRVSELEALKQEGQQAKKALLQSKRSYEGLVNSIDGIVWEADAQTLKFIFVSQQAERLLGYPVARWLNEATFWADHIHPDDQERTISFYRQAATAKILHEFEYRMLAAEGQVVWLRDMVSVIIEANQPPKLRGISIDITQHKEAEDQLKFQKSLLESQNETMLDGILIVAKDRDWIYYNQRFLDIWNFPEDILKSGISKATVQWIKDQFLDPKQFTAEKEYLYDNPDKVDRQEIILKDARIFDRYSAPVKSSEGVYYGRIWYYRDITAHKQLEEQLRHAQKMEAIGQMAGGVAHNFNNMLTAIMGYAGLAETILEADHPIQNDLQNIQKTARRAADLTQQLLAFTRHEVIQPIAFNLNDLVLKMKPILRQLISEAIEINISTTPDIDKVKIDPNQFEQVVVHLAMNAQEAMPEGGQLSIETAEMFFDGTYNATHSNAKGKYVRLTISDTGRGISKELQEHIFEPFFTTKEVGEGVGLGLASCYGIVKQNEGHITVYSETGQGSSFKIYLPCIDQKPAIDKEEIKTNFILQGTETILLVEDDATIRTLAVLTLRRRGYTVLEARHGKNALEIVETQADNPIQLVITDVIMPQMGGVILAEQLRIKTPDLKILFLSGYSEEMAINRGWLESNSPFLQKPFSPNDLLYKIREILDG